MSKIPLAEKEKEFGLLQAREAFKKVIRTCAYIENNNIKPGDDLYYPLITAIYVLYSRPFMANYGFGKLDDILVPNKYKDLHEKILTFRHKVFAHRQLKESRKGEKSRSLLDYHNVYFIIKDDWLYSQVAEELPGEQINQIYDLSRILLGKVRYHSKKLCQRYRKLFPEESGTYKFLMDDDAKQDFVKVGDQELEEATFSVNLPKIEKEKDYLTIK